MIVLLKNVRIILTIHNINNYFDFDLSLNMRRLIRFIGKKWLINLVGEFNVISDRMIPHLKQKIPEHKRIHNIPGAFFDESVIRNNTNENLNLIKIVIPGTVEKKDAITNLFSICSKPSIKKI